MSKINFANYSQSILRGRPPSTSITHCRFTHVVKPIHIEAISYGKLKPQSTRMVIRKNALKLRDILFDFCVSINDNGGAIEATESNIDLTGVEFLQCKARLGGGLFAKICDRIKMRDVSFFKCEVDRMYGGMYCEECDLDVHHSFWVMNHATMHGAFYVKYGHVNFIECCIHENNATRSFAGATFEECDGQIQSSKFVDNHSPVEVGGVALYIPTTKDIFAIEYCTFDGGTMKFFSHGNNAQVSIQENCFDVVERYAIERVGTHDPTVHKGPKYGNNMWQGQCPAAPPLPARYYTELFHHPVEAKTIEWWKLYAGLGIFLSMIAMMAVAVPAVFFPLISRDATRIGSHPQL